MIFGKEDCSRQTVQRRNLKRSLHDQAARACPVPGGTAEGKQNVSIRSRAEQRSVVCELPVKSSELSRPDR